jgi:arylsulfatase A-like enzyme
MILRWAITLLALLGAWVTGVGAAARAESPPNIVFILADDLGLGDVGAFNPRSKIPTPHLDRLAAGGMRFTDAHSSSAVCTPTRYGIMTGRYNWRSRLQNGVLTGYSRRLIERDRLTLPLMLRARGYHTACLGKWHLGMDWPLQTGGFAASDADARRVDYTAPIRNGPNQLGFDEFFGISASLDMPPYVFIRNDRVQSQPTTEKTWIRTGPAAPEFDAVDVLPALTREAAAYVRRRAGDAQRGQPFFLYLSLASPHTPIVPPADWLGRSGLNAYADFVMQTDAAVGTVLEALRSAGLERNTLVLFASDNGCSPQADLPSLRSRGHDPMAGFRGHKADLFEGGHRVPLLAHWPGRIRRGAVNRRLVCLNDLMATCAELSGAPLPPDAGEDSISLLPLLRGERRQAGRDSLVHHSIDGSFAIRQGKWKLCLAPHSGGWSAPRPGSPAAERLPAEQLYDLDADPAETRNVVDREPEVARALRSLLERTVNDGRSTPGSSQ